LAKNIFFDIMGDGHGQERKSDIAGIRQQSQIYRVLRFDIQLLEKHPGHLRR
jgi:hypothetical protein